MSEIHLKRIQTILEKEFSTLIDLSDVEHISDNDKEKHFLTRAQAALALSQVADVNNAVASNAIVDGFDDNGIDAIYFDNELRIVYVVQSKWDSTGKKSPDLGSIQKFIQGVKDLLSAKFERFNEKIKAKQDELEFALENPEVSFELLIVYTGTQPLSKDGEQVLQDLVDGINDVGDIVKFKAYNQKDLYAVISRGMEKTSIILENVTLYDFGQISDPYYAVYGQVTSAEIASWYQQHGQQLLARNLRKFKGDTEVNQSIKKTLISETGKFWYFNNGITVLCDSINKAPKGSPNRDVGQFRFNGVSVVNGAQTVGVIATTVSQGFPKAGNGRVLVRFISLENCPPDFAVEVTTATNTQNKIELRDFASLDPTQERLRQDLLLDLQKVYAYKSGDVISSSQEGCTIDEATIALACSLPEVQFAADSKRYISQLWGDIHEPPYTLIFNENLSAHRLWRSVEVSRIVESTLQSEKSNFTNIERLIAVHGNRFILHRVLHALPLDKFDLIDFDMSPIYKQAAQETLSELERLHDVIRFNFPNEYLNTLFKSRSKCEQLVNFLPKSPPIPSAKYFSKSEDLQPPLFN
jgi:hypothetical protein